MAPGSPAEERHVTVEARAIDLDPVATLDDVELGDHPGGVIGGVPWVDAVADQGRWNPGGWALPGQSDPQVPVGEMAVAEAVEHFLASQRVTAEQDPRAAAGHDVCMRQALDECRWRYGRRPTDNHPVGVDVDFAGVDPAAAGLVGGLELAGQLVRGP